VPKVYVPSLPTRFDAATKKHVPTLDLSAALKFGEIVVVTQGLIAPEQMEKAFETVMDSVVQFRDDKDFILPIGDPIINSMFSGALEQGTFSFLRWNREDSNYKIVKVTI